MEINIREWRKSDLVKIREAWLDWCRNTSSPNMRLRRDSQRVMSEWLASKFEDSNCFGFVAEGDGNWAGFVIARVDEWESTPPILEPRKVGIIEAVYVQQEFRRCGIGAALVEHTLQAMRHRKAEIAETVHELSSDASSAFWQRTRFEPWMVHAHRTL